MRTRNPARSKPEFSPGVAIVFSLPLLIAVSAFIAPWLWDFLAGPLGWSGANPVLPVRDWFMKRFEGLVYVLAGLFSAPMVIFCLQTRGRNVLRWFFLVVHAAAAVLIIGPVLWILAKVMFFEA
jgi:hypothetical protein